MCRILRQPTKNKPLRSLKNFRRLFEKHPDLIFLSRQWAIRTHNAIRGWAAHNKLYLDDNEDAAFLDPIFQRYLEAPIVIRRDKRLRVLTYRWHSPHQYELYRSGHEFTLVTGAGTSLCDNWDWDKRPLPRNARFLPAERINLRDYDLAILHFDENVLHPDRCRGFVPSDWGQTLRWFMANVSLPKIAICHGTPQFAGQYDCNYTAPDIGEIDETARLELVQLMRDVLVICNSHQALAEWGFHHAKTIWHGFSPHEFPQLGSGDRVLTMLGAALENRPHYNGLSVVQRIQHSLGNDVAITKLVVPQPDKNLLPDPHAFAEAKFRRYVRAVGSHGIYLNPTLRSPMPRSRGEAMMLGLVSLSMRNHDVDLFIRNGVNGFFADDANELAEHIRYLIQNPSARERMAAASRQTALDLFNQDRYLAEWSKVFDEIVK
ncbi:MAG: glycosyltransferase [Hyphomicrobiaceae bacterium]